METGIAKNQRNKKQIKVISMESQFEFLEKLLAANENEHLEFKEAKNNFDFDKLVKYCVAFANEGGGKIVLGVTDRQPRQIVGTNAYKDLEGTKTGILRQLKIRIEVEEIIHPRGRVLIFDVPPRHKGVPIHYNGAYWMRAGETLVAMTPDMLKGIFLEETGEDFSASICSDAVFDDLHTEAIEKFRIAWRQKSRNAQFNHLSNEQLLTDAELLIDGELTNAALVLFGSYQALGKCLPQAEVIFEYRSSEASGPAQQRLEFREGFFLFEDKLTQAINLRNDVQHFQDGLFIWDIRTFNETVIREAILNAVCHRDYRLQGSVFIRQYPRKLEIESPGGFPPGINASNILWRQSPRNRRIAETLAKCGLVERSGQGINRMYEECIKESKALPDFSKTDGYQVSLTLHGEIQDTRFLRFIEKIKNESLSQFSTEDLLVLNHINREQKIPDELKSRVNGLVEHGVIEQAGRGKYILSRRFYSFIGKKGVYTRKRGLDRNTNKELLLRHIRENKNDGSPLRDLTQVLPFLTKNQVQKLLSELKKNGKIYILGNTRAGRWYPASNLGTIAPKPGTAKNSTQ